MQQEFSENGKVMTSSDVILKQCTLSREAAINRIRDYNNCNRMFSLSLQFPIINYHNSSNNNQPLKT